MRYENTRAARFVERPNRFVAVVETDGAWETVHVKNTGRCKELLLPGAEVVLALGNNPNRKTRYDLIAVRKPNFGWVNIDSQAPNKVVAEWLAARPKPVGDIDVIKPEHTFGKSRVDFYMEGPGRRILLEVKGCTLEIEGVGYFPDAPTERGVKHLRELAAAAKSGYECYVAFVIAMPKVKIVLPNIDTHPEFGAALAEAEAAGVKVLHLPCRVSPDEIYIVS
ncbi:MAG: DNA/RNA nuclease SfsA [Abditibacteriota bacterium]|nr:DNA/RNA nuclease SfsA [Abditibacteriota bacterium]